MRAATVTAALALAAVLVVGGSALAASPADGVAPSKAAWFDATRLSTATPPAKLPGVAATDLVVQGVRLGAVKLVTAFAALSYELPAGATAGDLSLTMAGGGRLKSLSSNAAPVACPVTTTFADGTDQPLRAAPKYDCSKGSVSGVLTNSGTAIEFPDIGRFATGSQLSFVILPGKFGVDQLVFAAPDAGSLPLQGSVPTGSSAPPSTALPSASTTAASALPSVSSAPGFGASVLPPVVSVVPVSSSPAPSPSSATTAQSAPQRVETVSVSGPFDTARERTAAVGMLVVLIAITALLVLTDHGARLRRGEWGLGRFRSVRVGLPPPL